MPLTDLEIRNFQPALRTYKKADGLGLYLEVTPQGSKFWRWKYRIHGAEKRLSMGRYPEVSLSSARAARDDARARLAAGRSHYIKARWMISLLQPLHDLPISEIGPAEMLEALKRISATGRAMPRVAAKALAARTEPAKARRDRGLQTCSFFFPFLGFGTLSL